MSPPLSKLARHAHLEKPLCVGVQPILGAEEGLAERFVERIRLKNVKLASIDESLDSKSKSFKRGSEVRFDI